MCNGEESNLFDCVHRGVGAGECDHNSDVGVVCERKRLQIKQNKSYYPPFLQNQYVSYTKVKLRVILWCILEPCYDVDAAFKGAAVFEYKFDNVFYDVKSAYDCQKECQRWAGCEYFTWNSGTGPGRWNKKNANTCWLKRDKVKVMQRNKDSGKISGPREC